MVAESSILLRIQNCTEEEETRVSELLVESVRNQILQSNHDMSGESLSVVESAVKDAFGNIKNGKMIFTNTLSNVFVYTWAVSEHMSLAVSEQFTILFLIL